MNHKRRDFTAGTCRDSHNLYQRAILQLSTGSALSGWIANYIIGVVDNGGILNPVSPKKSDIAYVNTMMWQRSWPNTKSQYQLQVGSIVSQWQRLCRPS